MNTPPLVKQLSKYFPTALPGKVKRSPASVRPSVCSTPSVEPTDLRIGVFVCVQLQGHDLSSLWNWKSQSWVRAGIRGSVHWLDGHNWRGVQRGAGSGGVQPVWAW